MSKAAENAVIFLVLILVAPILFWLAGMMPLHIDEAITHQHFVAPGWKTAVTSYKFPNNHVLFSLLSCFVAPVFQDPILGMRSISVLAGLANVLLLFKILRYRSGMLLSALGSLLWVMSLAGFYYSVHGRGYGLQLMFILTSLLSVLFWEKDLVRGKKSWLPLAALVIASVLGFFTIPTYLFPFASLVVWMLIISIQNGLSLKNTIAILTVVGGLTSLVTIALYIPIVKYNGLDALIANQWVAERKIHNLSIGQITSFLPDVLAYAGVAIIVLFGISVLLAGWRKKEADFKLLLVFLLVPILIMALMGSIPFPRTFAYLVSILVVFIVWFFAQWKKKWVANTLMLFSLLPSFVFIKDAIKTVQNKPSSNAEVLHAELAKQLGAETIYVDGWNETAHLIDYYSWRTGQGPKMKFVYEENVVNYTKQQNGKYLLSTDELSSKSTCEVVFKEARIKVYRCN